MTPWGPVLIVLGAIGVVVLAVVLITCRLEDRPPLADRPGSDDQFGELADAFRRLRKHREKTGRFQPVAPTERPGQASPPAGPLTSERTP